MFENTTQNIVNVNVTSSGHRRVPRHPLWKPLIYKIELLDFLFFTKEWDPDQYIV